MKIEVVAIKPTVGDSNLIITKYIREKHENFTDFIQQVCNIHPTDEKHVGLGTIEVRQWVKKPEAVKQDGLAYMDRYNNPGGSKW